MSAAGAGGAAAAASLKSRVEALEEAVRRACVRDDGEGDAGDSDNEYYTCGEDSEVGDGAPRSASLDFDSGPPSTGSQAGGPPIRGSVALARERWRAPDASIFLVRDLRYLSADAGGHKQPSEPALFDLIAMDLLKSDPETVPHGANAPPPEDVARCPDAYLSSQHAQRRLRGCPLVFVLNIMVPGPTYTCLVAYWACANGQSWEEALRKHRDASEGEINAVRMLVEGDPENDDKRFKLAPIVERGPWAVRAAVGGKPCLLGTKVRVPIHRSPNPTPTTLPTGAPGTIPPYVEVDVDVGSSSVARHVVGLAHGASKILTVHLGVTSEPKSPEELPERILACVTLDSVDMGAPSLVAWPPAQR